MGVIKRGILGGFSGKVANVIGSSWKGIAYMKSMPLSVANPQTTAQTTQRNAFGAVVAFAGLILADYIKPLWDRFAQGMSGYNDFVSKNIEFFANGVVADYSLLKMSIGTLYSGNVPEIVADASGNTITCGMDTGNGTNGSASDKVYIVVWNITQGYVVGSFGEETRSEGTIIISDDDMATADLLKIYISYRKADGTMVSTNTFVAVTVVA